MFSRVEREFLRILGEAESVGGLEIAFPNPVYRRKLMWGIRRKVESSLGDWDLLLAAAKQEPRVLPSSVTVASSTRGSQRAPPVFSDPVFVALHDWWARSLRRAHVPLNAGPKQK